MTLHLRATGRHLSYGITQCYLPPDTSERASPNPNHAGWYSIYLPRRDGRLSWPSWLDSAPAGSRTSDLSITSPTPNRCTTCDCPAIHARVLLATCIASQVHNTGPKKSSEQRSSFCNGPYLNVSGGHRPGVELPVVKLPEATRLLCLKH